MSQIFKKTTDTSAALHHPHRSPKSDSFAFRNTMQNCRGVNCFPIQRRVAGWGNLILNADVDVYHGTTHEHARNIRDNGIQNVPNGFGGGQLGRGFYTYTTQAQAAFFGTEVLHFKTSRQLTGQEVPAEKTWANLPDDAYPDNDFLHTAEDANQYKFHNAGGILRYIDYAHIDQP